MVDGLMDKFDKLNINYDLIDITQNVNPVYFLTNGSSSFIYFVFSFILTNVIRFLFGKNN